MINFNEEFWIKEKGNQKVNAGLGESIMKQKEMRIKRKIKPKKKNKQHINERNQWIIKGLLII